LQVTELALGTSPTDTSLWKLNYEYGELNQDGSVDATKNNGNIAKHTISFQGLSNPFVQAFKYDSLERLIEARETTNGSQNWIQTFGYDRYGNRISFAQTIGSQRLQINNITHPSIDPSTNRFTTGQGYTYDFNGNLITDAQNRKFSFNGDNKQVEVKDANNVSIGQYFYDADGRRVKKITATENTVFVYDGSGKLVAEYSNQVSQNPTTSYVATDTLQSVRAITNSQGEVISRRDFMPFGEELYAGTPNRTEGLKYCVLSVMWRDKWEKE
jgi:YD repeat-containing protein